MTHLGRRKAFFYGLLLLAAVVGVVIDRTRFGPAAARGERSPSISAPPRAGGAEESDALTVGPAIAPVFDRPGGLAEKLASISPAAGTAIRDIFTASPAIEQYYGPRGAGGERGKSGPEADPEELEAKALESFRQAHRLQATCLQAGRSWALIDDTVVRVGDNLDGFALRQIDHYRVVFTRGRNKVDLLLPVPSAAKVPATEPR
jgi:hypothetical protein